MPGQFNIGANLVGVDNNLRVGVSATATLTSHTGHVVTIQNGIITNVMPPGGSPVLNTAYLTNVTNEINEISAYVNSVNPCAQIQALVNRVMADLQAQITSIEQQIAALVPIITIPSANLGAIVGWITSFVTPSIQAAANLAIQAEQLVAAAASLAAAVEAAASRIEHCSITVPTLTL